MNFISSYAELVSRTPITPTIGVWKLFTTLSETIPDSDTLDFTTFKSYDACRRELQQFMLTCIKNNTSGLLNHLSTHSQNIYGTFPFREASIDEFLRLSTAVRLEELKRVYYVLHSDRLSAKIVVDGRAVRETSSSRLKKVREFADAIRVSFFEKQYDVFRLDTSMAFNEECYYLIKIFQYLYDSVNNLNLGSFIDRDVLNRDYDPEFETLSISNQVVVSAPFVFKCVTGEECQGKVNLFDRYLNILRTCSEEPGCHPSQLCLDHLMAFEPILY